MEPSFGSGHGSHVSTDTQLSYTIDPPEATSLNLAFLQEDFPLHRIVYSARYRQRWLTQWFRLCRTKQRAGAI